jgi:hypothetical protein
MRALDNDNDNAATITKTALMPTTMRITLKRTTTRRTAGGRTVAAATAAAATNQRICPPTLLLVFDYAGAAAIVVFINNAGIP